MTNYTNQRLQAMSTLSLNWMVDCLWFEGWDG